MATAEMITSRRRSDFMALSESYRRDGYRPYLNPMDAEVIAEIPCEKCGGTCHGTGFRRDDSYVVYSACERCGDSYEF